MKYVFLVLLVLLLGCSQDSTVYLHNDIKEYQGVWRDTVYGGNEMYTAEFVVDNNHMLYTLTQAGTHIVCDKLDGTILLGNENKLGWYCSSPITNTTRQMLWNVRYMTDSLLCLYSNLLGEYLYCKVGGAVLDEYIIEDTVKALLEYKEYLPLPKNEIIARFGEFNRLPSENDCAYMLNHPLYDRIFLKENPVNDSVYSYTLSINNWGECERSVSTQLTKVRAVKGVNVYCDAESLEFSSFVAVIDTALRQFTFSPLKDYDYWPDVSQYLGFTLQEVKNVYGSTYVYAYSENSSSGLFQYDYQTSKDGVCRAITFVTDSTGLIKRSAAFLLEKYSKKQEQQIVHLLNSKYHFDRYENELYYYYLTESIENSPFEVRYSAKNRVIMYFGK